MIHAPSLIYENSSVSQEAVRELQVSEFRSIGEQLSFIRRVFKARTRAVRPTQWPIGFRVSITIVIVSSHPITQAIMFGSTSTLGNNGAFSFNSSFVGNSTTTNHNPMKDFEVSSPPDDAVSGLAFSPPSLSQNFLVSGSWDNQLRCWEVHQSGQSVPKAQQSHQGPVLDVAWSDDGTKVFSGSVDKTVKMWDLNSNQCVQIGAHDGPVKTVHWIKAGNYQCVMTGSWDKTLKFWDTRSPNPIMNIQLQERVYCADVLYPMAVVSTANRGIFIYTLENQPREYKPIESPLKYQHRCVSIFTDKTKRDQPVGFGLGSVEGRVAIQYVQPTNPKDNFTFKCHRSNSTNNNGFQDIFPVNDIAFHPVHGTLATVGSDGKFSFWDKDARTKLKTSEQMDNTITRCCFNARGEIFAYAVGYDWSKGHEFSTNTKKNYIFLHPCFEELKPRQTKK